MASNKPTDQQFLEFAIEEPSRTYPGIKNTINIHNDAHSRFRNFNVDANYTFLRTVAAPEAISIINEPYDDERIGMNDRRGIMDNYLAVLYKLLKSEYHDMFTKGFVNGFTSYHLVNFVGMWVPPEYLSWPVVHVVEDKKPARPNVEKFRKTVESLKDRRAYKMAKAKESRIDERREIADRIYATGRSPLVIQDRTWEMTGKQLRDAVDFLATFRYSNAPNHDCACSDDD